MQRLFSLWRKPSSKSSPRRRPTRRSRFESLERREVFSADPLPVLMVIADSQDFYYQEYGDTRASLEAAGLDVVVAATTTQTSVPHAGSGEPAGGGAVTPDLALSSVDADNYSAIVFVGGWGSSMYQYDFPGDYNNNHYDGDLTTKTTVNNLINDFVEQDKHVAAICHGVTVLAWARVDGVSPLSGKQVSVPYIGSPAVVYNGDYYGNFALGQYEQVVANGAIANTVSGQYGNTSTVADDVIVDGRIITAENYDAAAEFGRIVAAEVIASAAANPDPEVDPPAPTNTAPTIVGATYSLLENSAAGTVLGTIVAADADVGQTLTFSILAGNDSGAFAIDSATGELQVANSAALDFETSPLFELTIGVTDDGAPVLSAAATVTVQLADVAEPIAPGIYLLDGNLHVQGTSGDDTVYLWTDARGRAFAWMNGVQSGPHVLVFDGRTIVHAGEGNDRIFATDSARSVSIFGEGGHDLIVGSRAADLIDGGEGYDRIMGMQGNDIILGGAGNDFADGGEGNDVLIGGDGNDRVIGSSGRDVLIGGRDTDRLDGGEDEDLLIGGSTDFDASHAALLAILGEWTSPTSLATRATNLLTGAHGLPRLALGETVHDDETLDCLLGGNSHDWYFAMLGDALYQVDANDRVTA